VEVVCGGGGLRAGIGSFLWGGAKTGLGGGCLFSVVVVVWEVFWFLWLRYDCFLCVAVRLGGVVGGGWGRGGGGGGLRR